MDDLNAKGGSANIDFERVIGTQRMVLAGLPSCATIMTW